MQNQKIEEIVFSRINDLPCWQGDISIAPQNGGLSNDNFRVTNKNGEIFFVRIGTDRPIHGVMRFNEYQASIAAHDFGISPEVIYAKDDLLVLNYIQGQTLSPDTLQQTNNLRRVGKLLKSMHDNLNNYINGPCLYFGIFQVNRNYIKFLKQQNNRYHNQLDEFNNINNELSEVDLNLQLSFCHNDLLAANFIDDGNKLWLIDWEFSGFNSPLFDIANLVINNQLNKEQEQEFITSYFGQSMTSKKNLPYKAMKCASALRESLWSLVSEQQSSIEFNYLQYTEDNLQQFQHYYKNFKHEKNKIFIGSDVATNE